MPVSTGAPGPPEGWIGHAFDSAECPEAFFFTRTSPAPAPEGTLTVIFVPPEVRPPTLMKGSEPPVTFALVNHASFPPPEKPEPLIVSVLPLTDVERMRGLAADFAPLQPAATRYWGYLYDPILSWATSIEMRTRWVPARRFLEGGFRRELQQDYDTRSYNMAMRFELPTEDAECR